MQSAAASAPSRRDIRMAMILMYVAPLLFTANQVMARVAVGQFPPVALAFWRWLFAALLFLPFVGPELWRKRRIVLAEWRDLLALGALGMGICGTCVYIGAATTTATNIGIIYGTAPVMIVALAGLAYGERVTWRQFLGVALALLGMLWIIARGDPAALGRLEFTTGDLWIAACALAWAVYSVLLTHRPSALSVLARLAANMAAGALILLPFLAWETVSVGAPAIAWPAAAILAVVVVVPSLGAYQAHARVQRVLGASGTAPMLYVGPLYSATVAWLTLGEQPHLFHLVGALLILPGIYFATARSVASSSGKLS